MSESLPSRCANVSFNLQLPSLNCTSDILGDLGNLTNFGQGMGSVPGQLGNMAFCAADNVRQQIQGAINQFNRTLTQIFAGINTTISTPFSISLQMPEWEFESRMRALWQEFKLYVQQQMYNIIQNIPGLNFIVNLVNIPIPFLSGVRLFDVFSAEGRQRIRQAVSDRLDAIARAMGLPWNLSFNGELGLNIPELRLDTILRRIYSECERLLSSALWAALSVIHTLTAPIRRIWNALGLPTLPTFTAPNFSEFFNNIWMSIKDLAISTYEKTQRAIQAMLNFDLGAYLQSTFGSILSRIAWPFATTIRGLLRLVNQDWSLSGGELDFNRVVTAVQTLFNRIPQLILELWLQLIKPFLEAIRNLLAGVISLLQYIPFTMCTFLNIVAAPLFTIGGTIQGLLPPGITAQPSTT